MEYGKLFTEGRNPRSMHIDKMSTLEQLQCINAEDHVVVDAVQAALPQIAPVVDRIVAGMKQGGRLIYTGCGTSGRLGVLDASECPPTYGVSPELVVGIIAGGDGALRRSSEGAEDSWEAGYAVLESYRITENDTVVGISAAGGAAYVLAAMAYAKERGALTVGITSNAGSKISCAADIAIDVDTGAEVVTGSTRMKAGTAQKLILNMLSTGVMIRLGHVYENMMINLKPSNIKLKARMVGIVREITGLDADSAERLLEESGWSIRKAVEK